MRGRRLPRAHDENHRHNQQCALETAPGTRQGNISDPRVPLQEGGHKMIMWLTNRDVDVSANHPAVEQRVVVGSAETLQLERLLVDATQRYPRGHHVNTCSVAQASHLFDSVNHPWSFWA